MARPTYERECDRVNEERCSRMLAGLGFSVLHFPTLAKADFIATNGKATYLIEYKKRSHTFGTYPTVFIPADKLEKCQDIASNLSIGFAYVVEFEDGFYWGTPTTYQITIAGRTDRNDPYDIHRLANIQLRDFRKI